MFVHGLALLVLQAPLIETSGRLGGHHFFHLARTALGEGSAWTLAGLAWVALGCVLIYGSVQWFLSLRPERRRKPGRKALAKRLARLRGAGPD